MHRSLVEYTSYSMAFPIYCWNNPTGYSPYTRKYIAINLLFHKREMYQSGFPSHNNMQGNSNEFLIANDEEENVIAVLTILVRMEVLL